VLYTAPTLIRSLMQHGDHFVTQHDRSSLRILGTVGEPINPHAWEWYHQVRRYSGGGGQYKAREGSTRHVRGLRGGHDEGGGGRAAHPPTRMGVVPPGEAVQGGSTMEEAGGCMICTALLTLYFMLWYGFTFLLTPATSVYLCLLFVPRR
jgi:hypothetical protein